MENVDRLLAWYTWWQISKDPDKSTISNIINDCSLLIIPPIHISIIEMIDNINSAEASLYEVIWELLREKATIDEVMSLCKDVVKEIVSPQNFGYVSNSITYIYEQILVEYIEKTNSDKVPAKLRTQAEKLFYAGNILMYSLDYCNNNIWGDALCLGKPADQSPYIKLLHMTERVQSSIVSNTFNMAVPLPVPPKEPNASPNNMILMKDQDLLEAIEIASNVHKIKPKRGIQVKLKNKSLSKADLELIIEHRSQKHGKTKKKKRKNSNIKLEPKRLSWVTTSTWNNIQDKLATFNDMEYSEVISNEPVPNLRYPHNIIEAYLYIEYTITTTWEYLMTHGKSRSNISNFLKHIYTPVVFDSKYAEFYNITSNLLAEADNYDIIYNGELLYVYVQIIDTLKYKIPLLDKEIDILLANKNNTDIGLVDTILANKLVLLKYVIKTLQEKIRELEDKCFADYENPSYEQQINDIIPIIDKFKLLYSKLSIEFKSIPQHNTIYKNYDSALLSKSEIESEDIVLSTSKIPPTSNKKSNIGLVNPITGEVYADKFTNAHSSSSSSDGF